MAFNIFTSGLFKKNQGSVGIVIFDGREKIDEIIKIVDSKTKKESEYFAIIAGLKYLEDKNQQTANFFIDSQDIIREIKGEKDITSDIIIKKYDEIKLLINSKGINFFWVPESENKPAKNLANNILNQQSKNKFEAPSNILFEKAFFGKINCLKLQLSNEKEIYFHLGLLKSGIWDWKKVKMADSEIGEIIYLLKKEEGKCAFYHKWANGKTQIWCNKGEKGFNIKIDEVSKNLSIGETEVLRILLEECIRKGCC